MMTIAMMASPPTTPPTIGPTRLALLEFWVVGVATDAVELVAVEGVGEDDVLSKDVISSWVYLMPNRIFNNRFA